MIVGASYESDISIIVFTNYYYIVNMVLINCGGDFIKYGRY